MSETWGYRYINGASDRFICQIEGSDALDAYPEFRDRYNRADELISELLGSEPCLFYIRRQREAPQPEYEIWELTIATDNDDFQLPSKLQERQQTLQVWVSVRKDGSGCLGLRGINLVDPEQGQIDAFSSAWLIRLLPEDIGIPQEVFAQIITMPVCGSHVPTSDQIRGWRQYLAIQSRTANQRQFSVPFVGHNHPESQRHITFTLNVDLATGNGLVSLTPDEFWQRARRAINEFVQLFRTSSDLGDHRRGQRLGEIETVESSSNQIKVQLNTDVADSLNREDFALPVTGFLSFEDVGSLTQIRWQKQALENLQFGHTQNRYLGEFFFDAAKARPLPESSRLSKADLLLSEANKTQIAAVEAVLAAEDLVLIQGPPGTGKTTVIAEICYQVARRGGRTLIASQANLAVDNALSRLAHHPLLRPLREGDAGSRVGREGEPFLAHRVIDRWLENTAVDCENRLSEQQQIVQGLRPLLTSLEKFRAYLEAEVNFPLEHQKLIDCQTQLAVVRFKKNSEHEILETRNQQINLLKNQLNNILESNSMFLAERAKTLQNLKTRQSEIAIALDELSEWTRDANSNIYNLFKQSLQQRLFVTEDLIYLPRIGLSLAKEAQSDNLPWKDTCDRLLREINQLITQCMDWDEICKVANRIYWLLFQTKNSLADQNLSAAHISLCVNQLKSSIDSTQPLQNISQLLQITQRIIRQSNQSQEPQYHYKTALQVEAIKQQYEILIEQNKPSDIELKLNSITAKYLIEITTKSQILLNELQSQNNIKINQLETHQNNLQKTQSPFVVLFQINDYFQLQLDELQHQIKQIVQAITELDNQIAERHQEIQILQENLNNQRNWWQNVWQSIPNSLKTDIPTTELFNSDFLTSVQQHFEPWKYHLAKASFYLEQYEYTMQNWIARLRQPSEEDLESISRKYLENVNVVGITCIKAAKWNFSQKFSQFDVVIIDEVSKSTPPELLIPALKGKKIVMIGDYRQLPPILDEGNLDEIAEELSIPRDSVQFLEDSWFKLQFEAAINGQTGITRRLNIQYRMHPQIMEAINQFYNEGDGGLTCGLSDPDNQRAHNLAGKLIREDQHIIWVRIPSDPNFRENRTGTSYENEKEVDCIEKLCKQMNATWAAKVANGESKKEIGIITFYGAQLRLIDRRISREHRFPNLDIRTGTVDRFQGMEKAVVIVSMVRNNHEGRVGFAETPERVNVAFSRAKELLVIVGCHKLFTSIPIYQEVSNVVERYRGFIDVSSLL
ncbi:AAA domain-containing protein [Nostoc sp. FACHB-133]|uniref:AAA domain-containing protein n=1 Tax=Nostoc sp. FACHB-133 TaxID=2692835 RepID=UPI0016824C32|nr:AAA domain-containing protein [Nostoc sp. FACHB-133]MBD2525567.1 AAA family ATPase [Nostoc sp. FACHB-133]